MILVTVGAQMAFPRLVDAVDAWAKAHPDVAVLAQINDQDPTPLSVETVPLLPPSELRARITESDVVVAHAGMGTIITCLELGVPLILLPRRADLRETRNDHQSATVDHFGDRAGVWAAGEADEIGNLLDRRAELRAATPVAPPPDPGLIDAIRRFVDA